MFSFIKKILGLSSEHPVLEKNAVFVDVRSNREFASGHVDGALNIPLEQLGNHVNQLQSFPQVVLYCRSGNRSAHGKKVLASLGVQNVVDAGALSEAQKLADSTGIIQSNLIKEEVQELKQSGNLSKDKDVIKVLIPTDFSVQSDFAYLMVKNLESHLSTETHFLHVMDLPDTVTLDGKGNFETCGEIDVQYLNAQKEIVMEKLNHLKNTYGNHINIHVLYGKITNTITQFAQSNHFDLIVMGTKGSWGIKEKLSPSQAQVLARKSEVPVLSLMCDRSDLVIKDILFVHDFKELGTTHLPLMNKFAKYFDAVYHQLYIATINIIQEQKYIAN